MKHFTLLLRIIAVLIIIPSTCIFGQERGNFNHSDTLFSYFDQIYGADAALVSGTFYYGSLRGSVKGDPYYFDDKWKLGAIETGNIRHENLSLKYDIHLNRLILKSESLNGVVSQVCLNSDIITRVEMNNTVFVPLRRLKDTTVITFGELLAEGEINYIVVKRKELFSTNDPGTEDYGYTEIKEQYLKIENHLYNFRNYRVLFKIFPDFIPFLKRYKKDNHLYTGRAGFEGRAELVRYCNQMISEGVE